MTLAEQIAWLATRICDKECETTLCRNQRAIIASLRSLEAQSDEVLRLREALDVAQTNASRYEWLRDHWDEPEVQKLHPWDEFSPDPDQLDEQIDAALGSQP